MSLVFNEEKHTYHLDGKRVKGVTTILGVIAKPALVPWAARKVAEHVADNLDQAERWGNMQRADVVQELKEVPTRERDTAALRGTEIHAIAERVIHGEEVEIPEAYADHVNGYIEFLDAYGVEPILTERSVASREGKYAGRFDSIVTFANWRGGVWMMDLKTSNYVYGETALQNAGYAQAEFYVDDADPDTERPMPKIDGIAVAHVTANGTFLYDLGDMQAATTEFNAARTLYETNYRRSKLTKKPVNLNE